MVCYFNHTDTFTQHYFSVHIAMYKSQDYIIYSDATLEALASRETPYIKFLVIYPVRTKTLEVWCCDVRTTSIVTTT